MYENWHSQVLAPAPWISVEVGSVDAVAVGVAVGLVAVEETQFVPIEFVPSPMISKVPAVVLSSIT